LALGSWSLGASLVSLDVLFSWLISHQPAVLFSQNKPVITNQPVVLFSQNKPAPAISHQLNEQAVSCLGLVLTGVVSLLTVADVTAVDMHHS
jgi:hypothetical protein